MAVNIPLTVAILAGLLIFGYLFIKWVNREAKKAGLEKK